MLVIFFRFGRSIGSVMVVAEIAWPPTKWVILIGSLLSTVGAGMQSLTGLVQFSKYMYFTSLRT